MPRSSKIIMVLLLTLAVTLLLPIVGEIAAVIIVFLSAVPLSFPARLIAKVCEQFGLQQHANWIFVVTIAAVALASAAYFALRLRSHWSNPQQKPYYLNAVMLTLGIPVVEAIAFFQLRGLFPATFHP